MFTSSSKNIGILCRGKSLESLNKFEDKFNKCFIVNDFEKEIVKFENILNKKEIIHFVSRISKVSLQKKQYKKFNIRSVQMSVAFDLFDYQFMTSYLKYKLFNLNIDLMPKSFAKILCLKPYSKIKNKSNYRAKFPNTGLMSIFYTAEYLNVENIYICGLDFYTADYVFRSKRASPLVVQHQKFLELGLVNFYLNFIREKKKHKFLYDYKLQIFTET